MVKLTLRYHCHLKAETTNTKVIKEVLAAVGIFSKNQLWSKNLFDFYLTKWYNMQSHIKERTPMLGKRNPQEALFYYFNMADVIPKNHILRLINKYVDFSS